MRWACLLAMLCLTGCVTVNERGQRVDRPKQNQPQGLIPDEIVQGIEQPFDSDDDGVIDTIPVRIFLFDLTSDYASPIWVDGRMEFSLANADGDEIAAWSYSQDETKGMHFIAGQVGPAYAVLLRLDQSEATRSRRAQGGWLSCSFIPVNGEQITTERPKSVVFGATGRGDVQK